MPDAGIKTLHLFAGAGGGILADLLLGHKPIGAVEIEAYPRKVLLQRQLDGCLPEFPIWDDVRTFRSDNPDTSNYIERLKSFRHELAICGGFPCQDISSAGKGAGITGERSGLWVEFARIIGEIRPAYVFVENSPLLLHRGLEVVLGDFAAMGYDARWGVVSTGCLGGPSLRKRFWLLAHPKRNQKRQESRRWQIGRMGGQQQPIPWNEPPERALSRLRGVDDRVSGVVDRTDAIRNGQSPIVAATAWRFLCDN